jgi:hypothetical protein
MHVSQMAEAQRVDTGSSLCAFIPPDEMLFYFSFGRCVSK